MIPCCSSIFVAAGFGLELSRWDSGRYLIVNMEVRGIRFGFCESVAGLVSLEAVRGWALNRG